MDARDTTYGKQTGARARWRGELVGQSLSALALGTLIGVLAVLPYEQLLGISEPTCVVLRSLASTLALVGLNAVRARDLVFDAAAMPVVDQARRPAWDLVRTLQGACRRGTSAIRAVRGNIDRLQDVLKVRASALYAPNGG